MTPIITYKKWWHRFIPHYREEIRLMNLLLKKMIKDGARWETIEEVNEAMVKGSIYYRSK